MENNVLLGIGTTVVLSLFGWLFKDFLALKQTVNELVVTGQHRSKQIDTLIEEVKHLSETMIKLSIENDALHRENNSLKLKNDYLTNQLSKYTKNE
jgi:regulator of replication initiation timing